MERICLFLTCCNKIEWSIFLIFFGSFRIFFFWQCLVWHHAVVYPSFVCVVNIIFVPICQYLFQVFSSFLQILLSIDVLSPQMLWSPIWYLFLKLSKQWYKRKRKRKKCKNWKSLTDNVIFSKLKSIEKTLEETKERNLTISDAEVFLFLFFLFWRKQKRGTSFMRCV